MTDAHDMISREAAIEAVQEYLAAWDDRTINGSSLALVSDAILALPSVGEIVKPLEWVRGIVDYAKPMPGMKYVACSTAPHGCWAWWLDGDNSTRTVERDEQHAKAAAQADYEARILAALDVQPAFLTPDVAESMEMQKIAERDGYEAAVQDIDLLTGGDGEFFASTFGNDCPDVATMKARIVERFNARLAPDVALVERAILDAQLRCMEQGRIDTPEEIRAAALALIKTPPAPSPDVVALAEARAQHIASVAAYNAKLELVKSLRAKGDWSQNVWAEANAMHETRSEFVKAAHEVADAALARKGGDA